MNSLRLQDVVVRFKGVDALRGVSVEAGVGEVLMLVGPNGAGKSTLLRVLLGLVRPDGGKVVIDGRPLDPRFGRQLRRFRHQLGYLPEAVAFSENLTGRQVLRFFASARAVDGRRIDIVLDRVGLIEASRRAVRGYSRGMRQRLGLAVAILAEPDLLVMDEPTGGLDQEGLDVLWSVLDEWRERERLVVLASHDLTLLERRVDRIGVLHRGELIADGHPVELRAGVALPVRVTLDLAGPSDALRDALNGHELVESDGGALVFDVSPDGLLDLMKVASAHEKVVRGVRVEEPGLDEVYDRLLSRGER